MMETKKYKLGDIIELQRGYDLSSTQMKGGDVLVAGSNGVIGHHNEERSNHPCITVGRSGSVGKVHYYEQPTWAHNTTLFVKNFRGNNPKYLYYFLRNMHLDEMFAKGSSVVPSLDRKVVHSLVVPFHVDIAYQRCIASVLSSIDRKIELNRAINRNLEAMAKQLYDYWFVQFDFPNEEGKPYKSSGGKMVWNEQLKREIPEGWDLLLAKDICPIVTGKEDANFSSVHGQYPFFTCSKESLRCDIPSFEGSAILIAGNGDFNVKHYSGKFNAYQRTYVLIPNPIYYACLYFAANDKIEQFKDNSNGSIIKFITKGDVENIELFRTKNKDLYTILNQLVLTIEHNSQKIETLTKQRDELLPLLMNGQVTVNSDFSQNQPCPL